MDQELDQDVTAAADQASAPFIGRWQRLVSTTNWEKGRIIHEWRSALLAAEAPIVEYSDEAWSRLVGTVSGQHAGRLRRVYERFGGVHADYNGLYWSHFQSALDWEDAEMWLEGAVQNHWSVARMRQQRWQALGGPQDQEPRASDVIPAELDEDFVAGEEALVSAAQRVESEGQTNAARESRATDFDDEPRSPAGPDFGDAEDFSSHLSHETDDIEAIAESDADPDDVIPVRPFADLPELPADLLAAFESFQLAILRHKAQDWAMISRDDVLKSLDALKALACAEP